MSTEKSITIFNGPATLILGMPLVTGHLTMSIIGQERVAWSQVFTYDPASKIMDTDQEKLSEAVLSYGTGLGPVLSSLMFISNLIIGIVNFFVSLIRGVLGNVVGIGFMGIAIVLLLALISLMISVYAFFALAPLILLSYALRSMKNARLREQESNISREAMALFSEALSPASAPMLAPQG